MKGFIKRLFLVIFLSYSLNGCAEKVEDFTLLRFDQAKIFIYLPHRFASDYRTKLHIKELSDDIVVDGDIVARVYEEKKYSILKEKVSLSMKSRIFHLIMTGYT